MSSGRPADSPQRPDASSVLKVSPRCPNCGRANVITFYPHTPVHPDRPVPTLVCLHCCPRPSAPAR